MGNPKPLLTFGSEDLLRDDIVLSSEPNNICTNNSSRFALCASRAWPGKFDFTIELANEVNAIGSLMDSKRISSFFYRLNRTTESNDTGVWAKTYPLLNKNGLQVGQVTFRPLNGEYFSLCQLNELDQIIIELQRDFAGEGSVVYFPSEICHQFIEADRFQKLWSFLPSQVQAAFEAINDMPVTADIFNGHSEVAYLIRMAILESNLNVEQQNAYGYKGLYQIDFSTLKDIEVVFGDDWDDGVWAKGQKQPTCLRAFLKNPDFQISCIKKYWRSQFNNYLRHELEINNIEINDILKQQKISFYLNKFKTVSRLSGTYRINAGEYTIPATMSALIAFIHLTGATGLADFIKGEWNDKFVDQHGTVAWNYAKKMHAAPDGEPYDVNKIVRGISNDLVPSLEMTDVVLYREGRSTIHSTQFQINSYLPLQMSWGTHSNPNCITMGPKQNCPYITFSQSNRNLQKIMKSWVKILASIIEERRVYSLESDGFILRIEGSFAVDSVEKIKNEFKKLCASNSTPLL